MQKDKCEEMDMLIHWMGISFHIYMYFKST